MADVRPLRALRYDPDLVGDLAEVTSPPYDVIDDAERAALLRRSPLNVVEIDLPVAPDGGDPYEHAAATLAAWRERGVLVRDDEPALWAQTQDYVGPDGARATRRGLYAAVRVEEYGPGRIRPHERTQPGPREDRLRLTRATRHNLSPIFSLVDRDPWPLLETATREEPWGEVTDDEGTVHRVWRVADPGVHEAVAVQLRDAELLIADGHHRYETSRVYAEEIGGEGPHRYVLMNLVSLDDPGLAVFPTHRLLSGLDDGRLAALEEGLAGSFELAEAAVADPEGREGVGVFGLRTRTGRSLLLRLRDPSIADRALAGRSQSYRRLDPAILEALVLRDVLGMSEADVEAKRGIDYAKGLEAAERALSEGHDAAFLLRPTPVQQVREVAAAGESMPPKSTFFYPKLLTGLLFNPLV